MPERTFLVAITCWLLLFMPEAGQAQDSGGGACTLSINGSGTSNVFIDASGCAGDTVAIVASADGNQKQFPVGEGPELYSPFNISQCDLDLNSGQTTSVTYTAIIVSGPDKGKTSATYAGTLEPDSPADLAPTVSLSGEPSPGTFIRPGETIALSVTANDDFGITAVKVTGPGGQVLLNKQVTPPPISGTKCHPQPKWQTITLQVPKHYVVPPNPPTPTISFNAVARDTASQESTGEAIYRTEAIWTGLWLLTGTGGVSGNICTANWRLRLWVKTTPQSEVTGSAEAQHSPIQGCRYAGPRDDSHGDMTFAVTGTFDGKLFRLLLKPTGGAGIAWGIAGLHLLTLPAPSAVELTVPPNNRSYAKGSLSLDNSGNVEGRGLASLAGSVSLECCSSLDDTGPTTPAKRSPLFLGKDDNPVALGGNKN